MSARRRQQREDEQQMAKSNEHAATVTNRPEQVKPVAMELLQWNKS